jgi:protease-4
MSQTGESTGTNAWRYVVVVVGAVLIGAALAPYAPSLSSPESQKVAVVSLEGPITDDSVQAVREDLRRVRRDGSVQAVVLRVNSPGGTVAATESLYLAVNKTASRKPVVASVSGIGASGAYWAMLPAERIYTTPGSLVGSVGVIGSVPTGPSTAGNQIFTGPDKPTGGTADDARTRLETLQRLFLDTVYEHRGQALRDNGTSRDDLAYAKVYTGARAVQNGVADSIGGVDSAIAFAASEASISNYRVVRLEPPRQNVGLVIAGESDGGNETVVLKDDPFGFRGVETTQYYALYGTVDAETEVYVDD